MADRMRSAKVKEGERLMAEGRKAVKTSLFKWNPDHDMAAASFDRAGTAFVNAKAHEQAHEAFMLAAHSHSEVTAFFSAGQSMEKAATALAALGRAAEASEILCQAAISFRMQDHADKAATTLTKAAETVAEADVDRAVELLREALEIYEDAEREQFCHNVFKIGKRVLLRAGRLEEAKTILADEIRVCTKLGQDDLVNKAYLSTVVIDLALDDYVAASHAQEQYMGEGSYLHSDECKTGNRVLDAWDARDQEAFDAALRDQTFHFLEPDVGRLAKKLKLGSGASSADIARLGNVAGGSGEVADDASRSALFGGGSTSTAPAEGGSAETPAPAAASSSSDSLC